jgi:OFA family oxalate/formate antiporter-like MFS transporter
MNESVMAAEQIRSKKNWTLAGTIIAQFGLGSVYTWSLFNALLAAKLSAQVNQVALSFGILTLCLAIASSLSGKLQDIFGVRNVTIGAGILLGLGLIFTSLSHNLIMLYVTAGIVVGFADGTGYLMTLSNCVKFFPKHKGLASACAIGAYGLGSLGFKFIASGLLSRVGLDVTFRSWGIIAMCLVIAGGLMMSNAPKQTSGQTMRIVHDFSLAEAIKVPQFWLLAMMFLTACMSGLYVIGTVKDIAQSLAHLSLKTASDTVAVIAVANLAGRLVLGILSDRLPAIRVVLIAQVICLLGMAALLFLQLDAALYFAAVSMVAFSFGGTITVYPSVVSDFFGLNNLTKNYGVIYLGFGFGSFIGSMVAALFGGFMATFHLILALLIISIITAIFIKPPQAAMAV